MKPIAIKIVYLKPAQYAYDADVKPEVEFPLTQETLRMVKDVINKFGDGYTGHDLLAAWESDNDGEG